MEDAKSWATFENCEVAFGGIARITGAEIKKFAFEICVDFKLLLEQSITVIDPPDHLIERLAALVQEQVDITVRGPSELEFSGDQAA